MLRLCGDGLWLITLLCIGKYCIAPFDEEGGDEVVVPVEEEEGVEAVEMNVVEQVEEEREEN